MIRTNRARFVGLFAGTLAAAGTVRGRSSAANFDFKHSSDNRAELAVSVRTQQMWDEVRRDTAGRLNVTFYPNSTLGSQTATFEQLRVGAIQFLTGNSGVYSSVVPSAAIDSVGFAFRSQADALSAMDGALGAYVRRELEAKGLYAFEKIFDMGFRQIESAPRPIVTAADFNGFKIRASPTKIAIDLFRTLGASPVALSGEEIYTALQTHLIDGTDVSLPGVENFKLYEVVKYISMLNYTWAGAWTIANLDAWHSLPADIQSIVTRAAAKYALLARQDAVKENVAMVDKLKGRGMQFNTADIGSFRARLGPYYARWKTEIGATAWSLLEAKVGQLS